MDFGKDTLAKIFCREEEGGVDFYLKCIFVKSQEKKRTTYILHCVQCVMFFIMFFVIGLPAVVCLLSGYW